ncbi:MAG: hypothetical protein ACYCPN_04815 [Thermoplasmata archaeon]
MTGDRIAWRRYFPMPWVGFAVLLLALIILTPVLYSTGPPAAGTIFTQAELVVDSNGTMTHLYLWGVSDVRYQSLSMGIATGFSPWNHRPPGGAFRWTTATDALAVLGFTNQDVFAVNVSALYVSQGSACYGGVVAFNLSASSLATQSFTPGLSVPSAISLNSLPLSIALVNLGSGCPP